MGWAQRLNRGRNERGSVLVAFKEVIKEQPPTRSLSAMLRRVLQKLNS
jgi:hypothetical protein